MKKYNDNYALRFLFSIIVLMCCLQYSFGQNKLIKGQIFADSLAGFQIEIINLSTQSGTVSKPDGSFKLSVNKGDSILFSSIQYKPYLLEITQRIIDEKDIKIHLETAVNMMAAVEISNSNLTGDLTKDIKKVPYFDQSKIGFPVTAKPSVEERRANYNFGPIGGLINIFTGYKKMLKRQLKNAILERKKDKTVQLVSRNFILNQLKIPEDSFDLFLYFCLDDPNYPDLSGKASVLNLIQFLNKKAVIFKERLKEPAK